MTRTPNPKSKPAEVPALRPEFEAEVIEAQRAEVAAEQATMALAKRLNYQGSLEPAVLENSARDAMHRIGMAVFELGGYLLLLKEACPHGEFMATLERLGVNQHSANKYMAVTYRFANASTSTHLERLGFSKMAELLPLDDAELEDLLEQEGGPDAVDRLSVRALREKVRQAKADDEAKERLLENKNKRIDQLERELDRVGRLAPDEALAELKKAATRAALDAESAIWGHLRQAVIALRSHAETQGNETSQDIFAAGLVGQVQRALIEVRDEFFLPDVSKADDERLLKQMAEWDK